MPLDGLICGLRDAHGLDLAAYDETFLRQAMAKLMQARGRQSVADCVGFLMDHRLEAEAFCRSLRINYSEFFRNPQTFALLEQRVLPGLIAGKKSAGHGEIRIWSAGCAAGQETWSLVILMDELARAHDPAPAYRVFASDLSEVDLAVARAGAYSPEAVANVRWRHLGECFVREGETFVIAPRLREKVDFSVHDLLDPSTSSPIASIYGDFDLILCCNLLFYYRPPIQQQILDKLIRALAPGGYCVTGEAEREIVAKRPGMRALSPPGAVFQKERESRAPGFDSSYPSPVFSSPCPTRDARS